MRNDRPGASARPAALYGAAQGDRALSQRLRELEAEGVVIRRVSTGPPVEVAYELSAKGRDLEQVIDGVERWAHEWLAGSSPHHTYERAHP